MELHPINFVKKVTNGVAKSEVVQTHLSNLKSIRVIVLYITLSIWVWMSVNMFALINKVLDTTDPDQRGAIVLGLVDKALMVFYLAGALFGMMLLVYVLKRNNFKMKLPLGIEFETNGAISDNGNNIAKAGYPDVEVKKDEIK